MPFYLTQSLHTALRQTPGRIATIHGERRHSYREFATRVARFAGGCTASVCSPATGWAC